MRKNNLGYIISGILFILFQLLSIILKFGRSNTVWAFIWMILIVIMSYISTIKNLKIKNINRTPYIVIFILLTMMIFAALFIIIGAIAGVPECQLPLY